MKLDVIDAANRILNSRGNILRIRFSVKEKEFEAFVMDDQVFIAIKDILLNREYEYLPDFELTNFDGKTIVDVGAQVGLFSLLASKFAKEVISIEPHPINFRLLRINISNNNVRNITSINKALWYEKTKIRLYEGVHSGSHSTFPSSLSSKNYEVFTTTLQEIVDEFGKLDLLKIDIEGSEFEVFGRLNTNILKKINHIVAEIHLENGDANSVIRPLRENGFEVKVFHPPIFKKSAKCKIEVDRLVKLKLLRSLIYTLSSLTRMRDESLLILYARKSTEEQ